MSSVDILVPDLPESVADATVATWHKKPGDAVVRDEVLVEIETDKVVLEVPASADGILDAVLEDEGATVLSRQILGRLREGNSAGKESSEKADAKASTPAQRQQASLEEQNNDALSPAIRRVSTPRGLVTPVLRDVDLLGMADIEKNIKELAVKGRDGKLTVDDLTGGNFTITNGGVFGSLMSTPIINPPQSAILGMHAIKDRPMAVNGKVEILPMMYLALSYDHRLIDGRESVGFLVAIKELLEDPTRLLLDV